MTSGMDRDPAMGTGAMDGGTQQGQQLQGAATDLINQATRTAEAQASTTMTRMGETLHAVAEALRDAGEGLRDQQPNIAGFADTAAQQVESSASYLREHDAGEAMRQVQDFARRQPALVIGGGLAAGLILGRLLRSGTSGSGGSGQSWGAGSGQTWARSTSQSAYADSDLMGTSPTLEGTRYGDVAGDADLGVGSGAIGSNVAGSDYAASDVTGADLTGSDVTGDDLTGIDETEGDFVRDEAPTSRFQDR